MADWRKNPKVGLIWGIVAVVTIALIANLLLEPKVEELTFICAKTGKVFTRRSFLGRVKFPVTCPEGHEEGYLAIHFRCQEHGHDFYMPMLVPEEAEAKEAEAEVREGQEAVDKKAAQLAQREVKCPQCGSTELLLIK